MMKRILTLLLLPVSLLSGDINLKDQLGKAKAGDFLVAVRSDTITLLHIRDRKGEWMALEEICVPKNRSARAKESWKRWVEQGAPGHTGWVSYAINMRDGQMDRLYSYTQQSWFSISPDNNIFSTLLNLHFHPVPQGSRKKIGSRYGKNATNETPFWQPRMIVDGKPVPNVVFDAFKTRWPNDGTELSGKTVEIYLPKESGKYPSYFPYWLEISGIVGKAKMRIIDSGSGLKSPKTSILTYEN